MNEKSYASLEELSLLNFIVGKEGEGSVPIRCIISTYQKSKQNQHVDLFGRNRCYITGIIGQTVILKELDNLIIVILLHDLSTCQVIQIHCCVDSTRHIILKMDRNLPRTRKKRRMRINAI